MDLNQQATQQAEQPTEAPQQPTPQDVLAATNSALMKKKKSLGQQMSESYSPAQISQAMAQVAPNSPAGKVGAAIATPNYAGLCLQWVDDKQGNTQRQPSAIMDFQANAQSGKISTSNKIPSGARVYFAPDDSNGQNGHVGIAGPDNTFTSATDNGIKTFGIKEWEKYTGQKYIGYSTAKT